MLQHLSALAARVRLRARDRVERCERSRRGVHEETSTSTVMDMNSSLCLPESDLRCAPCAEKISSAINDLVAGPGNVVRLLPSALERMKRERAKEAWRPG